MKMGPPGVKTFTFYCFIVHYTVCEKRPINLFLLHFTVPTFLGTGFVYKNCFMDRKSACSKPSVCIFLMLSILYFYLLLLSVEESGDNWNMAFFLPSGIVYGDAIHTVHAQFDPYWKKAAVQCDHFSWKKVYHCKKQSKLLLYCL